MQWQYIRNKTNLFIYRAVYCNDIVETRDFLTQEGFTVEVDVLNQELGFVTVSSFDGFSVHSVARGSVLCQQVFEEVPRGPLFGFSPNWVRECCVPYCKGTWCPWEILEDV